MIVLRAHLLADERWQQLLDLWQYTGVRLVLVCHGPRVAARDVKQLLGETPHEITANLHEVLPPVPQREPEPQPVTPDRVLPPLPDSDVIRFRADAWRRLSAEDFAVVDAIYGQGVDAACAWLGEHPQQQLARQNMQDHYLHPLFPNGLRPTEVAAGVKLLEAKYSTHRLQELAAGLLCVSRDRAPRNYPTRWDDLVDLQLFLTGLVADSPGRRHTVALLRGAQAGFLLHGLLLDLPADLPTAGGPGLSGTRFSEQTAARIRGAVTSPAHAATLATVLFTGVDPSSLAPATISGLSDDGTSLHIAPASRPQGPINLDQAVAFHIPAAAQPLLRAARTFRQLRGQDPGRRLLTVTLGQERAAPLAAAAAAGLPLPAPDATVWTAWHTRSRCWWVNRPLRNPRTVVPT